MGSHPHTPRAIGPEWYPQGPPLGYKPGQTRAPLIWNLVVPLGVIAVFLACLRFYVRACVVKDFGKDDWLLLATVIALLVLLSGEVWGTVLGIGKHQYDLHYIGVYGPAMVSAGMVLVSYYLCQCLVQCSILAFYLRLRLADVGGRRMRRIIYVLIGLSITNNTVAGLLVMVFSTVKPLVYERSKHIRVLWYTYGPLNLLMDLTIWSIPLPNMFSVMRNLPPGRRILLVLVFIIGALSWSCTLLRMSISGYLLSFPTDSSYNAPIYYVFYIGEVSLAISSVSLATLAPLVAEVITGFNKMKGKLSSTNESITTGYESRARETPAPSKGYASRPGRLRAGEPITLGNKGSFGGNTAVDDQELMEWKDHVSDIERRSQFVQAAGPTRSRPCVDGNVDLESTSSCPRCPGCPDADREIQLQILAPTATGLGHGTIHRQSSSSSRLEEAHRATDVGSACHVDAHLRPFCDACDTLPLSESTIHLMNTDTNTSAR